MATTATRSPIWAAEKRRVLAKLPLFQSATPELRREILSEAQIVRLGAGAYFLREGDRCAHFAMIVSGRMRVFKLAETGHEITLYHVGAGEACPLNVSCILSDRPVPAMAMVEEEVEAVVLPAAAFHRWITQHESLRSFVFEMFTSRLAEVMSLVEEVAFRRMDQRLARHLSDLFRDDGGWRHSIDTTHAQIAADLGTAREVVSRLLKELERIGAISLTRGRIDLANAKLLLELG
jgi:CRP/FNR family transcriptional regulator, anaerobic regulatory protein